MIALARAGLDYAALVREAEHHGLVPLLSRHLHALVPELCPPATLASLRDATEHSVRTSLALAGDLVRLLAALRAMDVPALAIKGPISAALCYGDLGLRTFSDLDLLIDAAHVERASRCLAELGYAPVFAVPPGWLKQLVRSDTERLYCHADGHRLVDLHWELLPRGYTFSPAAEGLFAATQSVRIGATEVPTLGTEATLIFLLLHGMKHDWSSLGWLCDVAELIRQAARLDWGAVLAWSAKAGPRRFIDIGLALAHQLLDAPVPEHVLQRGARDPRVAHVAGMLATKLCDPARDDCTVRDRQQHRPDVLPRDAAPARPAALSARRRAAADPARVACGYRCRRRLAPLHYFVRPVRLLWKHARLK